jgi:hypothetical protein
MRKLKGGNAATIDTNSNGLRRLKRCSRPEKTKENPEVGSLSSWKEKTAITQLGSASVD